MKQLISLILILSVCTSAATEWLLIRDKKTLKSKTKAAEFIFLGETVIESFKYVNKQGEVLPEQPSKLKLTVFGPEPYKGSDRVLLSLSFKPHNKLTKGDAEKLKKLRWTFINTSNACPHFSWSRIGKPLLFYLGHDKKKLDVRYKHPESAL